MFGLWMAVSMMSIDCDPAFGGCEALCAIHVQLDYVSSVMKINKECWCFISLMWKVHPYITQL